MISRILEFVAPHHCYGCGQIGIVLCDNCKYDIINEPILTCIGCDRRISTTALCGRCDTPYDRAWVCGSYHSYLGDMIKAMKFDSVREGAFMAAKLMSEQLPSLPSNTVIVPIPTIPPHIRVRGFDHTALMARALSRRIGIPRVPLIRRSYNSIQLGRSRTDRIEQAKRAFYVDTILDPGINYLILDDVVTTGATMRAAAQSLKDAGAGSVWAITLTREPLDE